MDAAYCDRLGGKITEDFWQRKQTDWQAEEMRIQSRLGVIAKGAKSEER
jgi:hypothetical protein